MKKTLITLAALAASVASAATYTLGDFTGSGTGTSNVAYKYLTLDNALTFDANWQLDITVTIGTENANDWGSTLLASGLDASAVSYNGGFQIWRSVNENYLSKVGDSGEDKASQNLTAGETYSFTVKYTEADNMLSLTGPGLSVTQTFADTTSPITYLSSSVIGKAGWDITITQSVPEPATATLSLLALAGLAARRRRK